jgi:hypothetical protein
MCAAGSWLILHFGLSVSPALTLTDFDLAVAIIWAGAILGIAGPLFVFILKHVWIRRRMTALLWDEDEGARLLVGKEHSRASASQQAVKPTAPSASSECR